MRTVAPPARMLAGLAVTAVPVAVAIAVAWHEFAVYGDRHARMYVFWSFPLLLVAVFAAEALVFLHLFRGGRWKERGWTILAYTCAGLTVAWFLVLLFAWNGSMWPGVLSCVPTTLLSLVLFRRIERNRRLPWALVAVPFLWGAAVGPGYAQLVTQLPSRTVQQLITPGPAAPYLGAVVVAANEEAVKALGVLVVLLVFRRRVNGLLGGLVVGAIVGVGFQFVEASLYMSIGGTGEMLYQYWHRQYATLLTSHTVYSGLAGAGIGLAGQQRGAGWKAVSVAGGLGAAVAAHALWNVAATTGLLWLPEQGALRLFVAVPANVLLYNGPFVVLYLVMVVAGLRFELRGLVTELRREALLGAGAVRPDEVRTLASARLRFRVRFARLVRGDVTGYSYVRTLHAAQIELAYLRWHRARGELGMDEEAVRQARSRVLAIRPERPEPSLRLGAELVLASTVTRGRVA